MANKNTYSLRRADGKRARAGRESLIGRATFRSANVDICSAKEIKDYFKAAEAKAKNNRLWIEQIIEILNVEVSEWMEYRSLQFPRPPNSKAVDADYAGYADCLRCYKYTQESTMALGRYQQSDNPDDLIKSLVNISKAQEASKALMITNMEAQWFAGASGTSEANKAKTARMKERQRIIEPWLLEYIKQRKGKEFAYKECAKKFTREYPNEKSPPSVETIKGWFKGKKI